MAVCIEKNILASVHINFLFGAGVNGRALPQLKDFVKTAKALEEKGYNTAGGLEAAIDTISDEDDRNEIKETFIEEFSEFHNKAIDEKVFSNNSSIKNIKNMLRKTYSIVHDTQNRNPSMKQINIYTLNYDSIIEKSLTELGYLFNEISASNTATKAGVLKVIGYDYNTKKYIPTFMISKLHGDIDNPIIPGKAKYKEMLNENYFEVAFNMKEQLCRQNSILIVIGYSGNDKHINKILEECINAGLTIYWYKFSDGDLVPFEAGNQLRIREQDDQDNKQDSTKNCYEDMEKAWGEKLAE